LANRFCGSRTIQRSYTLKRERGQDYLQLAQETRMFIFSRAQIDARD
jgi:hypothetical protein